MKLIEAPDGTWEIASPMFHGPIDVVAAREMAARLNQLAEAAEAHNLQENIREAHWQPNA